MPKLAIFGGTFNPIHYGHLLMAETALTQLALDQVVWVPTYQPPHKLSGELTDFCHRLNMVRQAIRPHPKFTWSDVEVHLSNPGSFHLTLADQVETGNCTRLPEHHYAGDRPYSPNRSDRIYAIDTLVALQSLYPDSQWYWLLGVDAFQSLPHWYRYQDLVPQCYWLVAPRLGLEVPDTTCKTNAVDHAPASESTFLDSHAASLGLCQQVAQTFAERSIQLSWQLLSMPCLEISSGLIRFYCRDRRSIRYLVPDSVRDYIAAHALYLN